MEKEEPVKSLYELGKLAAEYMREHDSRFGEALLVAVAKAYYNGSKFGWPKT